MKKHILFVLIVFISVSIKAQEQEFTTSTTTYYFIRHAEKDKSDTSNHNPELIKKGKRRARKWKRYFKNKNLDAIYSTNYKRTLSTAFPTANHKKLPVILYSAKQTDYDNFLKSTKGQSVLIVGHSNTTPSFVNAILNKKKYQDIDETINSKLFMITISNGQITDKVINVK